MGICLKTYIKPIRVNACEDGNVREIENEKRHNKNQDL